MKNKLFSGDTITIAAPSGGVSSGDAVLIGTVLGVAVADAAEGDSVAVQLEGVFELPKLSTDAPAVGAALYWDASEGELTTTSIDNTLAGIAFAAAGSGVTTVQIKLKGR